MSTQLHFLEISRYTFIEDLGMKLRYMICTHKDRYTAKCYFDVFAFYLLEREKLLSDRVGITMCHHVLVVLSSPTSSCQFGGTG